MAAGLQYGAPYFLVPHRRAGVHTLLRALLTTPPSEEQEAEGARSPRFPAAPPTGASREVLSSCLSNENDSSGSPGPHSRLLPVRASALCDGTRPSASGHALSMVWQAGPRRGVSRRNSGTLSAAPEPTRSESRKRSWLAVGNGTTATTHSHQKSVNRSPALQSWSPITSRLRPPPIVAPVTSKSLAWIQLPSPPKIEQE